MLRAPDGRVVVTTDLLLEGRHFRCDWSSPYDIGRKAAAQNLADVAAMGARPTALVVGLGLPGELPVEWLDGLADGLRDECLPAGASVAGGDISRSESVVLGVTALGDLGGRPPVTRSGARPGDVVAFAGRLGHAAAGLALFLAGRDDLPYPDLAAAHRHPRPPYDCGPAAAGLGATAMADVSDGLVQDLGHIAAASGAGVVLDPGALPVPEPLPAAAAELGVDPLGWVLAGGDDHALVATFPADAVLPGEWRVIGEVVAGQGVQVSGYDRPEGGWDHFRE
ncbi:thiamine-monophosphate kinase [Sphaerisporangium rufum]|uniref:Thiamine-monophosphate kinase n=1 Tax=Sphaerisporangium rufum TaxID=1381558 RepID=A0A919UZN9_9ACTN|nr:thiamine-monophosphate kinase [Sphaerisporangium rufum]